MAGRPKKQVQAETPLGPTETQYFRIAEAAAYLRCSPRFIGDAIRQEKLPKLIMGKKFILLRQDLDTFALSLRVAA
jgi:excisionase family DNA binding protein